MPPKWLRRPAASERRVPGVREGEGRSVRRRPALGEAVAPDFSEGEEVRAGGLAIGEWQTGLKLVGRGVYWTREVGLAFEVKEMGFMSGALEIRGRLLGTEDEGLL